MAESFLARADIAIDLYALRTVQESAYGTYRTFAFIPAKSASDPERTFQDASLLIAATKKKKLCRDITFWGANTVTVGSAKPQKESPAQGRARGASSKRQIKSLAT